MSFGAVRLYMVVKHELRPPDALISQLSVLSFIITVKKCQLFQILSITILSEHDVNSY